jgi:hypothetical protein
MIALQIVLLILAIKSRFKNFKNNWSLIIN